MPSVFSHVIVATAIGKVLQPGKVPWWFWVLGALLAVVPDLDVIGFAFGIRYRHALGHRGLSHSLLFAAVLAACVSLAVSRQVISSSRVFVFLFLACASHGILDAMTNGGFGIAFFYPFSNTRYFFPFRPIEVSPLGVTPFFSQEGLTVIRNELKWLWLPSAVVFVSATLLRRLKVRSSDESRGARQLPERSA